MARTWTQRRLVTAALVLAGVWGARTANAVDWPLLDDWEDELARGVHPTS